MCSSSHISLAMSACSESRCELTDTYSPIAIDAAPATSAAMPAVIMVPRSASAAATPKMRHAVEMIPSFAPSTIARSKPIRWLKCPSSCRSISTTLHRELTHSTEQGTTWRVTYPNNPSRKAIVREAARFVRCSLRSAQSVSVSKPLIPIHRSGSTSQFFD